MSSIAAPGASAAPSAFDEGAFRKKIPYPRDTPEYEEYERLIPVLKARKSSDKPRIVVITDIEQDYDDLVAIIFLSEMHRLGAVELAGFVANHGHPLDRAKFLRSIVHLLGLGHIEVARGTKALHGKPVSSPTFYELRNKTFANQPWNLEGFRDGNALIESLAREVDQGKEPLTVLLISSLQDISDYFDTHPGEAGFIRKHFKKFVSQGGYSVGTDPGGGCTLKPSEDAANNTWHKPAAINYCNCLVKYNLPSDAWSREAARASPLDGETFTGAAKYGPIGTHLNWIYRRQEFKFFWDPFHAPYMPRLNPQWYLDTRLVLDRDSDEYQKFKTNPPDFQTVLPLTKVIAYDGCAAMGAVGDDVMRGLEIMSNNLPAYNTQPHRHRVFGKAINDLGGIDGERMSQALRTFLFGALMATHRKAESLIPSSTVIHETETYEVGLDLFLKQLPYLKEQRVYNDQARSNNAGIKAEGERKVADLKAQMLPSPLEKYPKVPEEIPYELLYQDAMKGITY